MGFERYSVDEALDEANRLKDRVGKDNPTTLELDSAQKVIDKENVDSRPETQKEKWARYDDKKADDVFQNILMVIDNADQASLPGGKLESEVWNKRGTLDFLDYAEVFVDDDNFWGHVKDQIQHVQYEGVDINKEELRSELKSKITSLRGL
jgi:hypothetical protein